MTGRRPVTSVGRERYRTDLDHQAVFLRDGKLLEQLIMLLLQRRTGTSRRARSDEFADLNDLQLEHPHDLLDGVVSVHGWPPLPMLLLA
ncbi:MAG: hypothetical protein ACI9P3_004953 [Bradyrhizobium sp.]|jgi:hypothetical protein